MVLKSRASRAGRYILSTTSAGDRYHAFVPNPLPPDPPLHLASGIYRLMEKAGWALGRLEGLISLLPDKAPIIYFFSRREALASSQIEGNRCSLSDLLLFENDEPPLVTLCDVQQVFSTVVAMDHGMKTLSAGYPLTLQLIRKIHKVFFSGKKDKTPGEFRQSQIWVGGTGPDDALFVPPPPEILTECLDALEEFIQNGTLPTLIKAALVHVQFDMIRPFLTGNRYIGRMMIPFLLGMERVLSDPVLYYSLYLKTHRKTYYDLLQKVMVEGDWESWIRFFLTGILEMAEHAAATTQSVVELLDTDRRRLKALGPSAGRVLQIHRLLTKRPILSISKAAELTGMKPGDITDSIQSLQQARMVREFAGNRQSQLLIYEELLRILSKGAEYF
ncbi:MAG: Fic/DOC family N-terminal domain-containing protein [bacterium]